MIEKISELNLTPEEIGRVFGERYSLIKSAGIERLETPLKTHILRNLMTIGLSTVAGLGIAGTSFLVNKKRQERQNEDLKKSFNTVMQSISSEPLRNNSSDRWLAPVQAKLHSDPVYYHGMARDAYNVLANSAPDLALHPIVAKNFIVTTLYNEGEIPEQKLNTISQISNNSLKNKRPISFNLDSFESTFKSTGGLDAMKNLNIATTLNTFPGKKPNNA